MNNKSYQIHRLSEEQQQTPLEVLTSFFAETTLQEIRAALEDYAALAVTVEDTPNHYREDTLFLTKKLESALEAAYLLQSKKE